MVQLSTEVIVRETKKGKFAQEVKIGLHTLLADEPKKNGGDDTGPSPYDFLLTALGTCTAMTVRMYADMKKLPLTAVEVHLRHAKVYAEDCADCEKSSAKIDQIDRMVKLTGELTEDMREKLLEIANKCPVHRTLTSSLRIKTELLA